VFSSPVILTCIPNNHRECRAEFVIGRTKVQGLADGLMLVLVMIRVLVTPLKIVLSFPAIRFREFTISLVILGHVAAVHLVFILVPLVVVTRVFVIVPLGPVGEWWSSSALAATEPASAAPTRSTVRYRCMSFCSSCMLAGPAPVI